MLRINKKIKMLWGSSELGFSFMATTETTFFIFFLTDVAKLPFGMVAAITAVAGFADVFTAILAGGIIDKVRLKGGKYRPWLIYCPPFVMLFFILSFTKIGSDMTAAILCGIGYIVSHAIWNIAWTANRALVGKLSDDPTERAFLSGRIAAGANGGKIIASYFVPILNTFFLAVFVTAGSVISYTAIAAVASAAFLLTYLIHYKITKGYDVPEPSTDVAKKSVSLGQMLKVIVTNPQLIVLLIGDALRLLGWYMVAGVATYYAKVVLKDPGAVSIMLVLFYAGTIVGALPSKFITSKLGTKGTCILGCIGFAVMHGLCFVFPTNRILIYGFVFIGQIFFGTAYGLTTSMYSMCGTYSEFKTGADVKGIIMACSSMAIKIAIAIRGSIIAAVLAAIAYSADAAITPDIESGIRLLYFLIPAAFSLLAILPFLFYKIKDSSIETMEKEIASRKNEKTM